MVNGWSPSKRNNPYANSGMVVSVGDDDFKAYQRFGPLAGMHYQAEVEQKAFAAGGGQLKAPAQRVTDFIRNRVSTTLPGCSYHPGITSYDLREVLPHEVHMRLREGFELARYPAVQAWMQRVRGTPGYAEVGELLAG
mgnify:CR=1 FL=1